MKKLYFYSIGDYRGGICPVDHVGAERYRCISGVAIRPQGTARFMSMAGAFGALGGDLSTLSQNPCRYRCLPK